MTYANCLNTYLTGMCIPMYNSFLLLYEFLYVEYNAKIINIPLLILLHIVWYSCYITLTKFPYKFAKHMQSKFISSQNLHINSFQDNVKFQISKNEKD